MERARQRLLVSMALLIGLSFVLNPDLRAALLLIDALGLDITAMMVLAQLRGFAPLLQCALRPLSSFVCLLARLSVRPALEMLPLMISFRPLSVLACPALIVLPYAVRCAPRGR